VKQAPVRWIETYKPLVNLGHGVQFLHEDVEGPHHVVAFLGGFDWLHQPGSLADVQVLRTGPSTLERQWPEIVQTARAAVQHFLSDGQSLNASFRAGMDQCT
jgi:hypothetical protein